MIDSLIQFVLDEIAMDGDAGTTVAALDGFVHAFFDPSGALPSGAPACRPTHQNVDANFLAFVWTSLVAQPGMRVAVVEPVVAGAGANSTPAAAPAKGKKKAKAVAAAPAQTHYLRALVEPESALGRPKLVATYSDKLRIVAAKEASWVAMTRSHERPTSITDIVYTLLQIVARKRGEGTTVMEVGPKLGLKDQKSAFHYVKVLVELGIIKKFPTTRDGAKTNRIIHVRYLPVSEPWKIHIARDVDESDDDAGSDEEAQLNPERQRFTPISSAYLETNKDLIRGRILRVLRQRPGHRIPHGHIVKAIGILDHGKKDLRHLNGIIERMVTSKLVSKLSIEHPGKTQAVVTIPYVQLVEKEDSDNDEDEQDPAEVEEEAVVYPAPLGTVPIDRQILDLLAEADSRGMRNSEISAELGRYTSRTIDQVLNKLVVQGPPPPHLGDFHVMSSVEQVGREKFLTWFLVPAYLRRAAQVGLTTPTTIADRAAIGGWSDLEPVGFYRNATELDKSLRRDPESLKIPSKKKLGRPTVAKAKSNAAKAAKKASKTPARVQDDEEEDSESSVPAARGRKPKAPVAGAKPTYYERKKAEKAERVRLGLPPIPKRPASGGGRRPKVLVVESESEEDDDTPVQDQTPADDTPEDIASPVASSSTAPAKKSTAAATTFNSQKAASNTSSATPGPSRTPAVSSTTAFTSPNAVAGGSKDNFRMDDSAEVPSKKRTAPASASADSPAPKKRAQPPPSAPAPTPAPRKQQKKDVARSKPMALSEMARQNRLDAYIIEKGGIVEKTHGLADKLVESALEKDPNAKVFAMDRNILQKTIDGLAERGIVTETSFSDGRTKSSRRDVILRLPLTIDSPEYRAFVEEHSIVRESKADKDTKRERLAKPSLIPSDSVPVPGDDRATVRSYYSRHPTVLASQYGVHYGRFARARVLHLHLLEMALNDPARIEADEGRILVPKDATCDDLPLGIFLLIIPLHVDSAELVAFTSDPANHSTPVSALPSNIRKLIYSNEDVATAIFPTLRCLMALDIIEPLRLAEGGKVPEGCKVVGKYWTSKTEKSASYWHVKKLAPMYSYASPAVRLLSVLPIDTLEGADKYWSKLKNYALKEILPNPKTSFSHPDYPSLCASTLAHKAQIVSKTKWKDYAFLIEAQRSYLRKSVYDKEDPLDPDSLSPTDLQAIADDLLAPLDLVETFLHAVKDKSKPTENRKRARKAKDEDEEMDEDEEDEGEAEGAAEVREEEDKKLKVAAKRNTADAQRQKIFDGIVSRFLADHDHPVLNEELIDYLKKTFCLPNSSLGSPELENELLILWNHSQNITDGDTDPSIIPAAKVKTAFSRKDPYQLPKPKGKKKATVEKVKNVASTPQGALPDVLGNQSDFLATPAKPIPELSGKSRLGRNFWTPEQIELSVDAAAVIHVRADAMSQRVSWITYSKFFNFKEEGKSKANLLHKRTMNTPDGVAYFERLKKEFARIWKAKKGTAELPDPHPDSMIQFDLATSIRVLRANIDKDALRLAGPDLPVEEAEDPISLPSTLAALRERYDFDIPAARAALDTRRDDFWKPATGAKVREDSLAKIFFSAPYTTRTDFNRTHDVVKSVQALKMMLAVEPDTHSPARATAFLEPYEPTLNAAVELLVEHSVMAPRTREDGRVIPGRNYKFTNKFHKSFDETLSLKRANEANAMVEMIAEVEEQTWDLFAEDGDMMALLHLWSKNKLDFTINTEPSAHLRGAIAYQTRQTSDHDLELEIHVARKDDTEMPAFFHPSSLPSEVERTDDQARLDAAFESLVEEDDSLADELEAVDIKVKDAGEDGLSLSELADLLDLDRSTVLACVDKLSSISPPCVFWAGDHKLVVVSSSHLAHWAVDVSDTLAQPAAPVVTSKKLKAKKKDTSSQRLVLPVIWNDLSGKHVEEFWGKASRWVHGILLTNPGLTCTQIFKKADRNLLLSLEEVRIVLETFVRDEFVKMKYHGGEAVGGMDWESALFFKA